LDKTFLLKHLCPGKTDDKEQLSTEEMKISHIHIFWSFTGIYLIHSDIDGGMAKITI